MDYAKLLGMDIDSAQSAAFERYYEILLEWNKQFNLTAITDKHEVYTKHFADSLSATQYIKDGAKMLDIGSGAGFPGLPLAIVRSDMKFCLLDSLKKRVSFLEHCIQELGLTNVEAVHVRCEDFKQKNSFDVVASRAVAELRTLLEYGMPFLRMGGTLIAFKSQNVSAEIISARNALQTLGGVVDKCPSFILPESDIQRTLILVKKFRSTPPQYPRAGNKPKKQPL